MTQEDYLKCSAYKSQAAHAEPGFSAFYDEKGKRFFFAMLDKTGNVQLISEGYPQEKSRENGIQSVIKNRELRERYAIIDEAGNAYLSLRAGNRKEIARSCTFANRAEAEAILETILVSFTAVATTKTVPAVVAKAAKTSKGEVKTSTSTYDSADITSTVGEVTSSTSVYDSPDITAQKGEVKTTVSTYDSPDITVSVKSSGKVIKTEAKIEVATTAPVAEYDLRPDDYLFSAEYMGHNHLWDENGVTGYALFTHENGQFYFVVYNPNGSIYLRSEGFPSEGLRQDEFEAVRRNIERGDAYKTKELYGKFINVLFDENKREVARSAHFDTFAEAFASTPYGRMKSEATLF